MVDDSHNSLEMAKQESIKRKERSKRGLKRLPNAAENVLLGFTKAVICSATGLCTVILVLLTNQALYEHCFY